MRGLYTIDKSSVKDLTELEYCNDIIGELTQLSRKVFDDTQSVIDWYDGLAKPLDKCVDSVTLEAVDVKVFVLLNSKGKTMGWKELPEVLQDYYDVVYYNKVCEELNTLIGSLLGQLTTYYEKVCTLKEKITVINNDATDASEVSEELYSLIRFN